MRLQADSLFLIIFLNGLIFVCKGETLASIQRHLHQMRQSFNCSIPCVGISSGPMCASDSRTYYNKCYFLYTVHCLRIQLQVIHAGACTNCVKLRFRRLKDLEAGSDPKYIPNCRKNGLFKKKQCTRDGTTCFCVNSRSGTITYRPVKHFRCRDICPQKSRKRFLIWLLTFLKREYQSKFNQHSERSLSSTDYSNLGNVSSFGEWTFSFMDQNSNDKLEINEMTKTIDIIINKTRTAVRSKIFRCRKSLVLCDHNRDEVVQKEEWMVCLGLKANLISEYSNNSSFTTPQRGNQDSLLDLLTSLKSLRKGRDDSSRFKRKNCSEARSEALMKNAQVPVSGYPSFVPECTKDGFYERKQCYPIKEGKDLCFCMDPQTGVHLKGDKNCYTKKRKSRSCTNSNRKIFLKEISQWIQFAMHSFQYRSSRDLISGIFFKIDKDRNELLGPREIRPFKRWIKQFFKESKMKWRLFKPCADMYLRSCDHNGDRNISLSELSGCTLQVLEP